MIKQKTVRMVHARSYNYSWHDESAKNWQNRNFCYLQKNGNLLKDSHFRFIVSSVFRSMHCK